MQIGQSQPLASVPAVDTVPERAAHARRRHRFRTFQICSIGQRCAQAVAASSRYVEVAPSGGWTSIRSSISKPLARKRRIHSPVGRLNSTAPSGSSQRCMPK
jgi:uroporphyrinogen-III synthase